MDVQKFNIVLLPDDATHEEAIRRASAINNPAQDEYRLGLLAEPHVTLYQASFEAARLSDLTRFVQDFARGIRAVPVTFDLCQTYRGFIFWCVSRAEKPVLTRLQASVIERTRPWMAPQPERRGAPPDLSETEERHRRESGYHLVGESFLPHITLGKFRTDDAALAAMLDIPHASWHGTLGTLALATVGPAGQAVTILASRPLKAA